MASLDIFENDQVIVGLPAKIDALSKALDGLPKAHIQEIRQLGMMSAAVIQHDHGPGARVGHQVCMAARQFGVVVRPLADSVIMMPPLAMTVDEIAQLGAGVGRAIDAVLSH